jgi:hypothetical protein
MNISETHKSLHIAIRSEDEIPEGCPKIEKENLTSFNAQHKLSSEEYDLMLEEILKADHIICF